LDGRALMHESQSGVEVFTINIYKNLKKLHPDTKVVKPKSKNRYLHHLWEHFILPFLAKDYDILYSPANIAPFWTFKKTKLVVTLHDVAYLSYPKTVSKFFYYYYRFVMPLILKKASKVVTISKTSRDEIIKYYPFAKEKIVVIYNGILDSFFEKQDVSKKNLILYVGSLNERKNYSAVIKAFRMLPKEYGYQLAMVGNFSQNFAIKLKNKNILEDVKDDKNIIFYSDLELNQLKKLYLEAKVFIYPSFYEGFGLPPLEAMASGTAVIASNSSSIPEVVGDAGMLISPEREEELLAAMRYLDSNTKARENFGHLGVERAKRFSWEDAATRLNKILMDAAVV